jgi:hypothetical protein
VREWPIKHALIALGALGVSPKIGATRPVDFFVLLLLKHLHMTTRACLMTLTLPINVWVNVVLIHWSRIRDGMKRGNLDPQYLFALQQ